MRIFKVRECVFVVYKGKMVFRNVLVVWNKIWKVLGRG